MIEQKRLTSGHAIRLLSVPREDDQIRYAKQACEGELSVRGLGDLIDGKVSDTKLFGGKPFPAAKYKEPRPAEIREQEKLMSRAVGTKVKIDGTTRSGKVILAYYSSDELNRIIEFLTKRKM